MQIYKLKALLKSVIRRFFDDYLEVETPTVVNLPGAEYYLEYFGTQWIDHKNQSHQKWLRSSFELQMKKLLAGGYSNIYQIGKCYRNHGQYSRWHNPEFTMLEWYTNNQSFGDLIDQTHRFIGFCFDEMRKIIIKKPELVGDESELCKIPKLEDVLIISVAQCFKIYLGVELVDQDQSLKDQLVNKVLSINSMDDFESCFYKAMLEVIEPELKKYSVVMLYGFPRSIGMLSDYGEVDESLSNLHKFSEFSRVKVPSDGFSFSTEHSEQKSPKIFAKRVEAYVFGVELTNGCVELRGKEAHNQYFHKLQKISKNSCKQSIDYQDFITNYSGKIAKNTCGTACGVDRLLGLIVKTDRIIDDPINKAIYHRS